MSETKIQQGFMGNLSESQQQALEAMRKEFKSDAQALVAKQKDDAKSTDPSKLDDYEFLRRLRARNWVVKDAISSLRATREFRDDAGIGEILKKPPAYQRTNALMANVMRCELGYTKDQKPMYMELTGRCYRQMMYKYCRPVDVQHAHLHDMEEMTRMALESKSKDHIETSVTVMDLEGLVMDHKNCLAHLQAITDVDEAHYPETLDTIYLINCPKIFPAIWTLIKLFLDPTVASKVRMIGSDYKDILVDEVFGSSAELPEIWGGEKKVFTRVPPAESECMAAAAASIQTLAPTEHKIGAGKKTDVTLDIKDGQTAEWLVDVEANDINVTVHFEPSDGGLTVVVPEIKRGTMVDWGSYSVPKGLSGRLILRLDNGFSWMRAKTVRTVLRAREFDAAQGDVKGKHHTWVWHDISGAN